MTIIGVQLILIGFALFMVYVLFLHWKKKNVSNKMFGVWCFIWLVFIYFSIFPTTLAPLLKELFIVRVMDIGMIGAFMILTYVTIENNIKIKKTEEIIEKLVRIISLKSEK
jgi:hypothetical protein